MTYDEQKAADVKRNASAQGGDTSTKMGFVRKRGESKEDFQDRVADRLKSFKPDPMHAKSLDEMSPFKARGVFDQNTGGNPRSEEVKIVAPQKTVHIPTLSSKPFISTRNDFTLYNASVVGSVNLAIANGTVNSHLPTDMTAGGIPVFLFEGITGSGQVYLKYEVTAEGDFYGLTVEYGTVPTDTDTEGYQSIGDYSVSGSVLTIGSGASGIGSQTVSRCPNRFTSPVTYGWTWEAA